MLKIWEMFRYLVSVLDQEEQGACRRLTALSVISPIADIFSLSAVAVVANIAARENRASPTMIAFLFFMALLSVAKGAFELYRSKLSNRLVYIGAQKLSLKIHELLIKEDLPSHNEKSPMQALAMVREDASRCVNVVVVCIRLLVNLLTMIGYCGVLIYSSKLIGAISCLLFMGALAAVYLLNRQRMKTYGEEKRAYEIKTNAQVTIAFGAFKEMKVNDCTQVVLERYSQSSSACAQAQSDFNYKNGAIGVAAQNMMMTAIFLVLGAFMWVGGDLAGILSSLLVYVTALGRVMPMAYSVIEGMNNIEFSMKNYEVLKANLSRYALLKERENEAEHVRKKSLALKEGISVEGLSFRYSDKAVIFEDASIHIPAGRSIAIIGASGSGKTTFLDLVLGLLEPQAGRILYDDYDIVSKTDGQGPCQASIGDIVSHIPQTVYLNGETVRNNVAFFQEEEDIDDSRVEACLRTAQVWEDIERLPQGIHSLIGENGVAISGGQRQRVALARALYKEFELLVMDEATAALDMDTEKAVIDSIRQIQKDKTILMVTHHMSLADACDLVYRIEDRKIVRVR